MGEDLQSPTSTHLQKSEGDMEDTQSIVLGSEGDKPKILGQSDFWRVHIEEIIKSLIVRIEALEKGLSKFGDGEKVNE